VLFQRSSSDKCWTDKRYLQKAHDRTPVHLQVQIARFAFGPFLQVPRQERKEWNAPAQRRLVVESPFAIFISLLANISHMCRLNCRDTTGLKGLEVAVLAQSALCQNGSEWALHA
jgi:hypothetical protein